MRSTRTNPAGRCPACLKTLDGATHPSGNSLPTSGDVSVCAYCSAPLIFNDDLTLRTLTIFDYAALPPDLKTRLDTLRTVAQAIIQKRAG